MSLDGIAVSLRPVSALALSGRSLQASGEK